MITNNEINKILLLCEEYYEIKRRMAEIGVEEFDEFKRIFLTLDKFVELFPNIKPWSYYSGNEKHYEKEHECFTFKASKGSDYGRSLGGM